MWISRFDKTFFNQFLPDWTEINAVIHSHIIVIINKLSLYVFFWAIIPAFLYYNSVQIKAIIPFFILEIFLYWVFIKLIYDIFNWYNDVWIITNTWVVSLNWTLFTYMTVSVKYQNVKWVEIQKSDFFDTFLWKWDLFLYKEWWDPLILKNATNIHLAWNLIDTELKKLKKSQVKVEEVKQEKPPENFETVLKVLSSVVEEYLWKNWHKKYNPEEIEEVIEKTKKVQWTIDLRD